MTWTPRLLCRPRQPQARSPQQRAVQCNRAHPRPWDAFNWVAPKPYCAPMKIRAASPIKSPNKWHTLWKSST